MSAKGISRQGRPSCSARQGDWIYLIYGPPTPRWPSYQALRVRVLCSAWTVEAVWRGVCVSPWSKAKNARDREQVSQKQGPTFLFSLYARQHNNFINNTDLNGASML